MLSCEKYLLFDESSVLLVYRWFLKTIDLVFHKCHNRSVWDSTAKDEWSCGIAFLWKIGSVWNIDELMVRSIRLGIPLIFLLTLVHFLCVHELPLVGCFVFLSTDLRELTNTIDNLQKWVITDAKLAHSLSRKIGKNH